MTNYEYIKSLSLEEMAALLWRLEFEEIVPKDYYCNQLNCFPCEEKLKCFVNYLNKEKEE